MGTLTIGQVADRTGFSASTLRYYEDIGLVVPPTRSGAGYRLYDARALERLAFVAHAKQLGCSLDEITDLMSVWDGDECRPVQRRLHELVTAKLEETERRIAALRAFSDQLRQAAVQLSAPPIDGACDERCACTSDGPEKVTLGERRRITR